MFRAIDFYRAVLLAAQQAPTALEAECFDMRCNGLASGRQGREQRARAFFHGAATYGALWLTEQANAEAYSELIETDHFRAPKFVTFKHGRSTIKIKNTIERLKWFASEMIKGGNWALWGGGEKPASDKPKKLASVWKPARVKIASEQWEDGNKQEATEQALLLGGTAYGHHSDPWLIFAPMPVQNGPEWLLSGYSMGAGWMAYHAPSGLRVSLWQSYEKTRAGAERDALAKLADKSEAEILTMCEKASANTFDPELSLAGWRKKHGFAGHADEVAIDAFMTIHREKMREERATDYEVTEEPIEAMKAEREQSKPDPMVAPAAPVTPVKSLYATNDTPDPRNSPPLPELNGFKPGQRVKVPGRTGGPWTVSLIYRREIADFIADMIRVVEDGTGKNLDVLTSEAVAHAVPAEHVSVDCADAQVDAYIQAIAAQEVGELSEAIVAIEQVQGVATAELATVCAADPAQAVGSVGIGAAIPADSTPAQKTTERSPQADHLAARADVAQRHAEQASAAPGVGGAAHSILESAPGFSKVKPLTLDPRDLLSAGLKAEQLVGLGVFYLGNAASASGDGAITEATDTRGQPFGDLKMVCTLEDGRTINATAHSFTGGLRPIFQFDGKMHGKPYLAQLAAVRASLKAQHSSAQAIAQAEHARQLEALAAQFPQLERPGKNQGGKLAAINIRKLLKQAFKSVKFSVTSDYNSARVSWTDGPTVDQVQAVVGRFDIGQSDSQSDYFYTTETAFSKLFGGVQYLTTRRDHTDTLITRAIAEAFHGREAPQDATPKDWRSASGAFAWHTDGGQMYSRSVREILSKTTG